jgi:hypothetical protein
MASTKRRFGLRRLATVTRLASRDVLKANGFALPRILSDWTAIVGEPLGRETSPERLSRAGVLTVRVAGPSATELQHRAPEILERIATYFGHRAVLRLRLVRGPLPRPESRAARPLRPLTPEETKAVIESTAEIGNPSLREALRRLGRSVIADNIQPP